ncbi:helix-turn-helix domain-containing protein [Patescibacteria group bacterium]
MAIYSKLRKLLTDAGLTEAEITVYSELLKNPAQTKWEIVERTGLNRNAVYRAFETLETHMMVESTDEGFKALSLKVLVSKLHNSGRKLGKLANKIKHVAPFLNSSHETIEEFETFYTPEQIAEPYIFMAEHKYGTNLDFGDFENFIPTIGGIPIACKFRKERARKSGHHAICTTNGKYTGYFCTNDAKQRFKTQIDRLNIDFGGTFVIFSDSSDYVLFNHFADPNNQCSVLVKSKPVADIQRAQFDMFSQKLENLQ